MLEEYQEYRDASASLQIRCTESGMARSVTRSRLAKEEATRPPQSERPNTVAGKLIGTATLDAEAIDHQGRKIV